MSKFKKLLKALALISRKPYLLNLIVEHEDVLKKEAISAHNMPKGLPQIDIGDLFPEMKESIQPFAFLDGGSLPIDLALLKLLAKKYQVQDYLEIGTWRGESVANVASVVPNCYTLNISDEEIFAFKQDEDYVKSHRFFSENLPNVKHITANSATFDFGSLNQKFDMVFVDGDHHYEPIKKDTQTAFEIVKSEQSIIVWHDYLSHSGMIRWDVLKAILDGCPAEKRNKIYHVSNTLCAVYIPDTFRVSEYNPYKLPNKKFNVALELKHIY